jgi:hypothetical protein
VQDLDREVVAGLAEDLLGLLLDDPAGAVMRVDDGVADLEVDALGLGEEVLLQDLVGVNRCVGNDASSWLWRFALSRARRVVSRLQVPVHEVDLL